MHSAENVVGRLRQIVGPENVLTAPEDLLPYSFDATAAMRQMPAWALFTRPPEQVPEALTPADEKINPARRRGSATPPTGRRRPGTPRPVPRSGPRATRPH